MSSCRERLIGKKSCIKVVENTLNLEIVPNYENLTFLIFLSPSIFLYNNCRTLLRTNPRNVSWQPCLLRLKVRKVADAANNFHSVVFAYASVMHHFVLRNLSLPAVPNLSTMTEIVFGLENCKDD